MSRAKNGKKSSVTKKGTVELDPSIIRFTHARIRPFFTGCGKRIEETIQELNDGIITIKDLPLITVIENDGEFFSLNNRRLYVIKLMHSLGKLGSSTIEVYTKPALEREKKRYTAQRCALHAKIMPEHEVQEERVEGLDSDNDEADACISLVPTTTMGCKCTRVDTANSFEGYVGALNIVDNSKAGGGTAGDALPTKNSTKHSDTIKGKRTGSQTVSKTHLPPEIAKEMKELTKLVAKGKQKVAFSNLDEWVIAGKISELQRDNICESIGLTIKCLK